MGHKMLTQVHRRLANLSQSPFHLNSFLLLVCERLSFILTVKTRDRFLTSALS